MSEEQIEKIQLINTIYSGITNIKSDTSCLLELDNFLNTEYKVEYEPFIITTDIMYTLLNLCSHKSNDINLCAQNTSKQLVSIINEHSIKRILPVLLDFKSSLKWKTSLNRLILLDELAQAAPLTVSRNLNTIIPVISDMMWDSKPQIKKRASKTMTSLCNTLDNKDIIPFIPDLVKCIEDPNNVLETVHKLASTTFVQSVTSPALSIMVPLLKRGFVERKDSTIRLCARIVDNMAKLVYTPLDAAPFLPELLPLLESAKDNVSDPEVRSVCECAYKSLSKSGDLGNLASMKIMSADNMLVDINSTLSKCDTDIKSDTLQIKAEYISLITSSLIDCRIIDKNEWALDIKPYLNLDTDYIFDELYNKAMEDITIPEDTEGDDNVEVLCDCNFSLAYGNKILLNSTNLKLKRGYNYGLVGKNDCGKTSLLRAIANGQVDGFPVDQVRTIFVETDVQGNLSDLTAVEYIYSDPLLKDSGYTKEQITETLNSVGFKDGSAANTTSKVGQLSGGWRMKLALARAMLLQADILLLDEPTNHLDPYNVSWLQQYLKSITNVTVITISSDKRLLDEICSHIIQIDALKLNYTKGNLSNFVEKHPEAQSYFDLKACKQKFIFPAPGPIEGVTSKGKIILKMNDITFTYPGVKKAQLHKVSVRVSMSSRVAVVGANGAGKSTMIKLLTGELKPDQQNADGSECGEVWKHPNCKIAYVAQHAFHHIEHHLDKTPNEYIRWRFQYGDDKEALTKVTLEYTEVELARMKEPFVMDEARESDGEKIRVKKIMKKLTSGRRNASMGRGISYEYECEWMSGLTGWLPLQRLIDAGWHKAVKTVDEKVSARETAFQRPLTTTNVEKALGECGLSSEFATHTRMAALSGGQKVKVVLCSSMWSQPHIVILDEPTNYLDRDSMGALSNAIDDFAGGVVLITHNGDFSGGLCPEMWHLENNTLNLKGDPSWLAAQDADKNIVTEQLKTFEDASGNTVKIKPLKKTLSRAEKKKRDRIRKLRIKNGESISDLESEEEY
jgi:elongation factor 3